LISYFVHLHLHLHLVLITKLLNQGFQRIA
jgi:hypothetical protein